MPYFPLGKDACPPGVTDLFTRTDNVAYSRIQGQKTCRRHTVFPRRLIWETVPKEVTKIEQ